jgi:hypothetical protein
MATSDEIKEPGVEEKPAKPRINYLPGSETILFSDFVRIRSNESGFYLYFCNADPDEIGIVKCQTQVFLPITCNDCAKSRGDVSGKVQNPHHARVCFNPDRRNTGIKVLR